MIKVIVEGCLEVTAEAEYGGVPCYLVRLPCGAGRRGVGTRPQAHRILPFFLRPIYFYIKNNGNFSVFSIHGYPHAKHMSLIQVKYHHKHGLILHTSFPFHPDIEKKNIGMTFEI